MPFQTSPLLSPQARENGFYDLALGAATLKAASEGKYPTQPTAPPWLAGMALGVFGLVAVAIILKGKSST